MIIAINTRLRKEEQPEGYENFLFGILNRLTEKYPEHQFLYIFDKLYDTKQPFAKNVQPVIAGPETRTSLRLQYWFNYKIPAVLRKHKADVFVSMEGICSLRTKKPQCLLINDLSFLQKSLPVNKSQARFFKRLTPSFLIKAKSIASVSLISKLKIAEQYNLHADDITVISPGIDDIFKPMEWTEKETVREKYTEGKAYFLFSGNTNMHSNLINLLKAFSFFKKRQKSEMMLLIAGNTDESFKKELKTYKYRNELRLLENVEPQEHANIMAAAYALVYPVLYDDIALAPLQAMQCGVPVVTSNTSRLQSVCGEAALYADPNNFEDIAENMMLVFKDEDMCSKMANTGKTIARQYNCDKSADLLMQSILKAFNN